jgi:hypothetical protein
MGDVSTIRVSGWDKEARQNLNRLSIHSLTRMVLTDNQRLNETNESINQ